LYYFKFSLDSDSEKGVKIGQYLMKLLGVQKRVNFLGHLYYNRIKKLRTSHREDIRVTKLQRAERPKRRVNWLLGAN